MQTLGERKTGEGKVTFTWVWKSGFQTKLVEMKQSKALPGIFRGTNGTQSPSEDSLTRFMKRLWGFISTNARKPSPTGGRSCSYRAWTGRVGLARVRSEHPGFKPVRGYLFCRTSRKQGYIPAVTP